MRRSLLAAALLTVACYRPVEPDPNYPPYPDPVFAKCVEAQSQDAGITNVAVQNRQTPIAIAEKVCSDPVILRGYQ